MASSLFVPMENRRVNRRPLRNLARPPSIARTPIREAVFANLGGRGPPVRAQVDLTDANEERTDSDRQRNPLYGNRKTTALPATSSRGAASYSLGM
jgi:hypothetical protein